MKEGFIMKARSSVINKGTIEQSTSWSKDIAKNLMDKVENFQSDVLKDERLRSCKCKSCFYLRSDRIGGAAITTKDCGICLEQMRFASTAVDQLCKVCGVENDLCVQCAGDLNMVNSKKERKFLKED